MFAVTDIDELLDNSQASAQLVGEVVQYENAYRLCYIRDRKEFSLAWQNNSE